MSVNFGHVCIIYVKIYEKMLSGGLEVSLSIFSVEHNTVDRDLNQYKIAVALFGAAYAAPSQTISCSFSSTNFSIISV